MVATLYAGFSTQRIGTLNVLLSDGAVTDTEAVVTTGTYSHVALASVTGTGTYTALAAAVEAALLTASPSADYNVTFSTTTRRYTITNAGNPFTIDFTDNDATYVGTRLAKALGLTASNALATGGSGYACVLTSSGADAVSDVLPYYLVPLARDEPMAYSRPFEPTGMIKRKISTNGNTFSVEPLTLPEYLDLGLAFMPLANVFADDAAASQPWTIQHLVRHARCHEPILFDFVSTGDLVCKLGESNGAFGKDLRELAFQQPDYHNLWHIKFTELLKLGRL